MKMTTTKKAKNRNIRRTEAGLTLVELMIACLVLVIGIVAMAQLFVVATMSQSLAVNQSSGAEDAQRFIDALRVEALNNGIGTMDDSTGVITYNPNIWSATYSESGITGCASTAGNSAFVYHMYCYDPLWFKPSVWVYGFEQGVLINEDGTCDPASPPGVDAADLKSPSKGALKVFVRLDPRDDSATGRRSNLPINLTALVSGEIE